MPQQAEQGGRAKPVIRLLTVREVMDLPDPEWLIKDILVKDSLALLYGPPGVGKSFLALSLAYSVAAGTKWHDRDVDGGAVVYLAVEGGRGLKFRISALRKQLLANCPQ